MYGIKITGVQIRINKKIMQLSIIIVNYKTPHLTLSCINSIYDTARNINFEIIVVDNNSQDGSEERITSRFPKVLWIKNPVNEGFGRANNIGIKAAKGEFVLFLNSDVTLITNSLAEAIKCIKNISSPGVLGIKLLNENGTVQEFTSTIANYQKVLDLNILYSFLNKNKVYSIEAVMGSFMLIPMKVIDECGAFDPDFFMYSEEIELCNRIKNNGYSINYLDNITAIHKNGGSTPNRKWAEKQSYLSNSLLFFKLKGFFGFSLYHLIILLNFATNFFLMWLKNKSFRDKYWKDISNYFSQIVNYITIPMKYKRTIGNGNLLLKAN